MPPRNDSVVRRSVCARVGLVGNPSDGFGGAVLGTVVPGLAATVTATAVPTGVRISGPDASEHWASADELTHDGPQRIVTASVARLGRHTGARGVSIRWDTDIPRSVGLAGSSALAVGTIDATARCWGISLDRRVVAALALSAERDVLGIAAGWQDRIIQSFGCTALVDAAQMDEVDGLEVPRVACVTSPALRLVVGWNDELATSSDDYHAPLRRSAESMAEPMGALAALARSAHTASVGGDVGAVAAAVDAGWQIRQSCAPLRPEHAALVEHVRAAGVSATTPGSGGAVVAVCPDEGTERRAIAALIDLGCEWRAFSSG